MKNKSFLFAALIFMVAGFSTQAKAYWCDQWGYCYPGYPPGYGGVIVARCSPSDVQSNVQTADQVLSDLSKKELSHAETFKLKVAAVQALPAGQEKVDSYFHLAGIKDPSNTTEVMNFIYARQVDPKNVEAVKDNLQLSDEQAKLLINKLTSALKPRQ